ncbi:hypothetical protein [Sinosporangium siamense]|uniref:Uncharacterized protein n=1 Tax=Sinosporangium siamense TaxID=1367973 RepID=A0A919RHW1_9ACTN|nr:hypothetical protein [Sinosporangium siamense]GII93110.1 hypothetical protein Ssi02_33410 [Sinosporangium siamense]
MNFCLSDLVPPLRWSDAAVIPRLREWPDLPPAWWRSTPISRLLHTVGPEALGDLLTDLAVDQWPAAAVGDILPALHVLDPDDLDNPQVSIALDRAGSFPGLLALTGRELLDQPFVHARPVLRALFTGVLARLAPAQAGTPASAPPAREAEEQAASREEVQGTDKQESDKPGAEVRSSPAQAVLAQATSALAASAQAALGQPDAAEAEADSPAKDSAEPAQDTPSPSEVGRKDKASEQGAAEPASAGADEPEPGQAAQKQDILEPDDATSGDTESGGTKASGTEASGTEASGTEASGAEKGSDGKRSDGKGSAEAEGEERAADSAQGTPPNADQADDASERSPATPPAETAGEPPAERAGALEGSAVKDSAVKDSAIKDGAAKDGAAKGGAAKGGAAESSAADGSAEETNPATGSAADGKAEEGSAVENSAAENNAEGSAAEASAESAGKAEENDAKGGGSGTEESKNSKDGKDGDAEAEENGPHGGVPLAEPLEPLPPAEPAAGQDAAGQEAERASGPAAPMPAGPPVPEPAAKAGTPFLPFTPAPKRREDGFASTTGDQGGLKIDLHALIEASFAGLDDKSWAVAQNRVFTDAPSSSDELAKLFAVSAADIEEIEADMRVRLKKWLVSDEATPYRAHAAETQKQLGKAAPKARLLALAEWHGKELHALDVPAWQFVLATLPGYRLIDGWVVDGDLAELQERTRELIIGSERPPTVSKALELVVSLGIHPDLAKEWLENVPQLRITPPDRNGTPPQQQEGRDEGGQGEAEQTPQSPAPAAAPVRALKDVSATRRCFRQPDGRWWLRVDVTVDHLKNAECSLPSGFAAYLGLAPDERRTVRSAAGDVTLSWISGPAIESVLPLLTDVGAKEGGHLFLTLSEEGVLRARHLAAAGPGVDPLTKALRLVGYTAPGGTIEQAARVIATRIGMSGQVTVPDLMSRLRERGDRDLLSLLA